MTSKCKLLALAGALIGSEALGQEPETWRVFIEPKFMKPEVAFPIAKAERTVLVPGFANGETVQLLSKAEFEGLRIPWEEFRARGAANATTFLEALKPQYARNRKNVIEYATLTAERPLMATAVLAPGFLKVFADVLGPKVLVVIPNRYVAYVFPALASNYRDYAPMVLEAYRATPYPVSLEVFEISADGMKAIGAYETP